MVMLTTAAWWAEFWANFLADILAGLVLALGFGVLVDQYLRLRDRRNQTRLREIKVLQLIQAELRINTTRVDQVLESLKRRGLIYPPPFSDDAWRVVNSRPLVEAIDADLLGLIMVIYGGLAGANRMVEAMWQADLAPESHELPRPMGWPDKPDELRIAILEKCEVLRPVLDEALEKLNAKLGDHSGISKGSRHTETGVGG